MDLSKTEYEKLIDSWEWSYSRLGSFKQCPYKFNLRYIEKAHKDKVVEKFYALYGTFIHEILERFYKGEIAQYQMKIEFMTGWQKNVVKPAFSGSIPKPNVVQKYFDKGILYFDNFERFPFNTVGVEKEIHFKIGNIKLIGYIDFLGEKDGEYYIVDNKSRDLKPRSGRKNPTKNDELLDSMLRQMYLYSIAVYDEYGKYPKELCFNCFKSGDDGGCFIREPFRMEKLEEAKQWALEQVELVKNAEDFDANADYFFCTFLCEFSEVCPHKFVYTKYRRY